MSNSHRRDATLSSAFIMETNRVFYSFWLRVFQNILLGFSKLTSIYCHNRNNGWRTLGLIIGWLVFFPNLIFFILYIVAHSASHPEHPIFSFSLGVMNFLANISWLYGTYMYKSHHMLCALIWYAFFDVISMYAMLDQKLNIRTHESELMCALSGFITLYVLAFLSYYFIEKPTPHIRSHHNGLQMKTRIIRDYDTETVNTEIIL